MKIEQRHVDEVKPYASNPRINEKSVPAVMRSIEEFGWRNPILVDEDNVIIAGHTRFEAAKRLGLAVVPVIVVTGLSPEQIKAYRIADNQTGALSDWNLDLLPIELADLESSDFDLSLLGFDETELAKLLSSEVTEGETDPDSVPATPEAPVSQPGVVYQLGRHRLIVGDATNPDHIDRLMGEDKASLFLTDPPYNVGYVGKTEDALTIDNDQMSDDAFREFLRTAFGLADSVMHEGASYYIWHADSEGYNFRGACQDVGWQVRQCLIWVKNSMVLGRQDYHWRHEPCLHGWKSGAAHSWYSDRKQTTVLEFDRPSRSTDHPTMKPVDLFVYQMLNNTQKDDIVLDLFGGSGTTMIAAERTGRVARVAELDPRYADVIRRRWAEFSVGENVDWEKETPVIKTGA